jgi:hypothetical protein
MRTRQLIRLATFGTYSRLRAVLAMAIVGGTAGVVVASASPAGADTPPYELYCPGTPIGNIVMNDTVTTGAITPPAGASFSVTNYQDHITIPANLVTAVSSFGSTLSGTVSAQVVATGATPGSILTGTMNFNVPIPVPLTALTLLVPATPISVGPFTSAGGVVSITSGMTMSLTLIVAGNPLTLTCTAYPNNTLPSGTTVSPPGSRPSRRLSPRPRRPPG